MQFLGFREQGLDRLYRSGFEKKRECEVVGETVQFGQRNVYQPIVDGLFDTMFATGISCFGQGFAQ